MNRAGPRADEVTTCKKCGASIMFLQSFNKKLGTRSRMPVNVLPTDKRFRAPYSGDVAYLHNEHQNHWSTCSDPGAFRGRR